MEKSANRTASVLDSAPAATRDDRSAVTSAGTRSGMAAGAVILAAGNGVRFGGNKLMYPVGGKPMFFHITEKLYHIFKEGGICRLALVCQQGEVMRRAAEKFPGILLVRNGNPELGISHSLKLGLGAAWPTSAGGGGATRRGALPRGCLFAVADQPYLTEGALEEMLEKWKSCGGIVAAHSAGGAGNPVIFPEKYFGELMALTGDTGGRQVMRRHGGEVRYVEVSERELRDIDVREGV